MSNIFISYGDINFAKSLKRIGGEARQLGRFDKVILYTPDDLPTALKSSPLFCFERGGGYWLWKPYLIDRTLRSCKEGDVVYYVDAGCTLQAASLEWEQYGEFMKEYNAIFFQYRDKNYKEWGQFCQKEENNNSQIYHWTKPSAIEYFKEYTNGDGFMYFNKIMASFIIVKKTSPVMKVIDEWFKIMLFHPQLVVNPFGCDLVSLPSSFNMHRHDQSILTPLIYFYREWGKLCVMPETGESQRELAAVVVTRKKDKRFRSVWEEMRYCVKQNLLSLFKRFH